MTEDATLREAQPHGGEAADFVGGWASILSASRAMAEGRDPKAFADDAKGYATLVGTDPMLRAFDDMLNANPLHQIVPVDWAGVARSLRLVWMHTLQRPEVLVPAAIDFYNRQLKITAEAWGDTWQRWWGLATGETKGNQKAVEDKRFAAPEWQLNPAFRTLKETYLLASDWLLHRAGETDDLSPAERRQLEFHLRQFVNATSPTLLFLSNPAAVRRAVETGGASVAQGIRNLIGDLKEGRLSLVDTTAFAPGRNLALSPGKVVYRNRLIELIQYAPAEGGSVHRTPILFLPPWINKFYILDLNPKKSMVRHLVEAGFTVFTVSWRNPDASMEAITIDDYLELGPLAASEVVREITGSEKLNVMGYCIGGTLLAMTLAWLAAKGDERFASATFMVSMQDFSTCGDTAVFLSEQTSLQVIEHQMLERGYLDKSELSNMFNLLRSNDLIWANVVNNYLMGEKPPAFDLLYWNSDGTRMARAAHGWYLRNTYVENNLVVPNKIELKGERLDLGRVKLDIYAVGAEKDHIVPWQAAASIASLAGGNVRYVLASSGHIAGIINPPGGKGTYWTNDDAHRLPPDQWRAGAKRHDGSWWDDWFAWLAAHSGDKVDPPPLGSAAHPPMADAPGTYVFET